MTIDALVRQPVHTLPPDATCTEAACLMRDENIGSVVVAEDDRPLGIVTDRDLTIRVIADGRDPEKLQLREIMSREPIYLGADRSLDQVIAAMRDLAIRRVPIVDAEGLLSGIVSLDDILLRLSDQLGNLAAAVRAELSRER
jgi:CBS domain-containing protein